MEIIRNVAGMELKITLTEEELKSIVAEFATITFKAAVQEPAAGPVPVQEPKKFTMPKTTHVGRMTDHMAEVKEMVERDYSYSQIAKYFDVSLSTINKYVKMWGFERPGTVAHQKKGLSLREAKAMLKALHNGTTRTELARTYNISLDTVRYWINRAKAAA